MNIGDILDGKYRIEKELGRGSFGAVYRAVQVNIDRLVAIKILKPKGKVDEEMQKRFKREAKLSSQLHSQHTIKIHDFGETADHQLYIVMEYLEGEPLDSLLRKEGGTLEPRRVAKIMTQVLESLGEAHGKGIVHRDIKPDNIFVCNNAAQTDFVKVFDFGIAKVVGGGGSGSLKETAKLTMVGGTVGTPAYMSPEQCCGEDLDPSSDIYSLGIVMYEMVTGTLPFEDPNPVKTMMNQINTMPPWPPPNNPAVAETAVGKALWKAITKDKKARFQTAEEFIEALKEPEDESIYSQPIPILPPPPQSDFDTAGTLKVSAQPRIEEGASPSQLITQGGAGRQALLWGVVIGVIAVVLLISALVVVLWFLKG